MSSSQGHQFPYYQTLKFNPFMNDSFIYLFLRLIANVFIIPDLNRQCTTGF
ncbi:hypothetical protein IV38_GL000292 [Lactobacillus selangorensis]|uniref:Uncharacterized protein n=1 Tax=Lactobacillus selangorensis TaxID=81857 RepID=A0A0R2FZT3_9LACO|nr:hypothetical protein IV38_GL000292 [Lactobacillus selangorensis]KRN34063.1 hypothetical protein IV40_GL000377 [Lactobacillus selangorensis]